MIRLERRFVFACKFQELRDEQRKNMFGRFRNFKEGFFFARPREFSRGGDFEIGDDVQNFREHFGGEPAHLRYVFPDPENLRINRSGAHKVKCHLQHQVQVTHGVVMPRKISSAEAAKCTHHVCDGEVAIDDFACHGLLEIPMPSGLVE